MYPATSAWSSALSSARRPEERGEDPAPVDVADHEHRAAGRPRDAHVHDVGAPQIDLGRTARPLADHGVIRAPQLLQALHDGPEQRLLPPAVVAARAQSRPPACPCSTTWLLPVAAAA